MAKNPQRLGDEIKPESAGAMQRGYHVAFLKAKDSLMNRTRVLAAGAVGALLVAAATSFASPWWSLHRLRDAVARHDADAVSAQVDFPALRASVKDQLQASISRDVDGTAGGNPFAEIGRKFAMAVANPLIDAAVSPEGVAAMVEHGKIAIAKPAPAAEAPGTESPQEKPRYALHYRGWDRFAVTAQDGGSFIFRRDGLWSWRLAGIEMSPRG
jgi:hypothetical protein